MSTTPDTWSTSATLLRRLHDLTDQEAWAMFVDRYGPRIFYWARRHFAQESDAADVTQEVLCKLMSAMRRSQYDAARGSFRGWLKTVTANTLRDCHKRWEAQFRGSGDTQVLNKLTQIQDESSQCELTAAIESQYRFEIMHRAETRVRKRVRVQMWLVYEMTSKDGKSASDTAESLQMSVPQVYVAKSRVLKMLRTEVQQLERSAAQESK